MEIVKHPKTKKCEGHRALEPWKRKLICSTYQEHPFGLCAMVMMLSGLICAKQNGGLMSETAFQNRFSSYLCFLETQVNGCHKRWYGQTKAHKALPARGEQLPPWREVKIRCHDFRVDFCTRAYEAEIPRQDAASLDGPRGRHHDHGGLRQAHQRAGENRRGKTDEIHGNESFQTPSKQGGDCGCGPKSLNRF